MTENEEKTYFCENCGCMSEKPICNECGKNITIEKEENLSLKYYKCQLCNKIRIEKKIKWIAIKQKPFYIAREVKPYCIEPCANNYLYNNNNSHEIIHRKKLLSIEKLFWEISKLEKRREEKEQKIENIVKKEIKKEKENKKENEIENDYKKEREGKKIITTLFLVYYFITYYATFFFLTYTKAINFTLVINEKDYSESLSNIATLSISIFIPIIFFIILFIIFIIFLLIYYILKAIPIGFTENRRKKRNIQPAILMIIMLLILPFVTYLFLNIYNYVEETRQFSIFFSFILAIFITLMCASTIYDT